MGLLGNVPLAGCIPLLPPSSGARPWLAVLLTALAALCAVAPCYVCRVHLSYSISEESCKPLDSQQAMNNSKEEWSSSAPLPGKMVGTMIPDMFIVSNLVTAYRNIQVLLGFR